jgi:hypothetical protein
MPEHREAGDGAVSTTISLTDPQTGSLVFLRRAELHQTCMRCGNPLEGEWICAVEGGVGWVHLDHLERELLGLEMTKAFVARGEARTLLRKWDRRDPPPPALFKAMMTAVEE